MQASLLAVSKSEDHYIIIYACITCNGHLNTVRMEISALCKFRGFQSPMDTAKILIHENLLVCNN